MNSSYENLLCLMRARRSVREFEDRPVDRDLVEQLLEAARWAPSNHNRQPWRFIVLTDRLALQRLAQQVRDAVAVRLRALPPAAADFASSLLHHATVFEQAPVLIIALHKTPVPAAAALLEGLPQPALVSGEPLSVAMAVQNLLLAAQASGLGACVLTAPLLAGDALVRALPSPLPAGYEMNCLIAVGHAKVWPDPPRRKSLELITDYWKPLPPDDDARTGHS
jgi:coenzyme F420-0:L-glutamate ligase / coenzyme F420-1:gamma-L-glutamate ligase